MTTKDMARIRKALKAFIDRGEEIPTGARLGDLIVELFEAGEIGTWKVDWAKITRLADRLTEEARCAALGIDVRVDAIRRDEVVGRGTCAMIDECYSDAELIAELDRNRIRAAKPAVAWARRIERMWREVNEDIRGTAW